MAQQITLLPHQQEALRKCADFNRCAFYFEMGLGKTFIGSEKLMSFGTQVNLIICQKSKLDEWAEHMRTYYDANVVMIKTDKDVDKLQVAQSPIVGVINYDLLFRRKGLQNLTEISVLFDESSMIKNELSKRAKAAMALKAVNVVLLSGTPVGGKYEELWSQCRLLGWKISKDNFYDQFIRFTEWKPAPYARSIKLVNGYKNVPELKSALQYHGALFLRTDEVMSLPSQTFQTIFTEADKHYAAFMQNNITEINGVELIGDTTLTKMLIARQLCSIYSTAKLQAFKDWVDSNSTRLIVFYNFKDELHAMLRAIGDSRPISMVNGHVKDLVNYERYDNSVTFIQYQAGAFGLNLQKANYVGYYSLPLSSELYEQSKKRVHRIGQSNPCFYYLFICRGTIEEKIKHLLDTRNDYTLKLFEQGGCL